MANLPSRQKYGKTISTGISMNYDVAKLVRDYADEHQWSFSKALENLARIGLEEVGKKKLSDQPVPLVLEKRNEHRHRKAM